MADPGTEARLFDLLAEMVAIPDTGTPVSSCIVTDYVVVAAFHDADGDVGLFFGVPDTQRSHQTLGLLEYARLKAAAQLMDPDG
jgi:hypothetical protein